MNVCVLIVNWNCREETLSCLRALRRDPYPLKILLVDNGSRDGSIAAVRAEFPGVALLPIGYNSGFAAAVNAGLQHPLARDAAYVLLLNNDVDLAPNAVSLLVAAAQAHPKVGILSASVFYKSAPDRLWTTGYRWLPITFSTLAGERGEQLPSPQGLRRVDFVEFCCVLIQRELFDRLGPLDQRFFVYYEDVDFCRRARLAGVEVASLREAHAWHTVSASSASGGPAQNYLRARSSVQFFAKHTPRLLRLPVILYRSYNALRVIAAAVLQGRNAEAVAYLRGVSDGLGTVLRLAAL